MQCRKKPSKNKPGSGKTTIFGSSFSMHCSKRLPPTKVDSTLNMNFDLIHPPHISFYLAILLFANFSML
ncbi:hypothetical protein BDA96_06G080000 [Sorghum bicolor]|uniref:Uncharacterized protein n=2 Tax=Sorghum bicolor TaxID=4558 RepID=A0A921QP45_SORBI|nr:hypothetical protein BDA96_06G080000 [Sorghum bicolor]OQU81533.1 hypothetical protein SORBI_3006G072701 [Sorghum bicolor]